MVDSFLVGVRGGVGCRKRIRLGEFVLGKGRGFRYYYFFVNVLRIRSFSRAARHRVGATKEITLWRW